MKKGLYIYSIKIDGLNEQLLNSLKVSECQPLGTMGSDGRYYDYLHPKVDDLTVRIENSDSEFLSFLQDKAYSLVESTIEKDYKFDGELIQRDPHGNIIERTVLKDCWIKECTFDNWDCEDHESVQVSFAPRYSETVRFNFIKNISHVINNIKKLFI